MAKTVKPDPLQEILAKSYAMSKTVKVYCSLCGQEIIWMADKRRELYLQEVSMGVHQDCAQVWFNHEHQHK